MQIGSDVMRKTIKCEKTFQYSEGVCHYQNIQCFQNRLNEPKSSKLIITNNLCSRKNEEFVKVTEVQFNGRFFYIQDVYKFEGSPISDHGKGFQEKNSMPSTSSDEPANGNIQKKQSDLSGRKKTMIFKKRFLLDGHRLEKRNTKNISKNFCKAFISILQKEGNKDIALQIRKMSPQRKYNNQTIKEIAENPECSFHFRSFLSTRATNWINSSRIINKKVHIQAIELYLQILSKNIEAVEKLNAFESSYRESDDVFQEEFSSENVDNQ